MPLEPVRVIDGKEFDEFVAAFLKAKDELIKEMSQPKYKNIHYPHVIAKFGHDILNKEMHDVVGDDFTLALGSLFLYIAEEEYLKQEWGKNKTKVGEIKPLFIKTLFAVEINLKNAQYNSLNGKVDYDIGIIISNTLSPFDINGNVIQPKTNKFIPQLHEYEEIWDSEDLISDNHMDYYEHGFANLTLEDRRLLIY